MSLIMQRIWAMPSADTFDCEPIAQFVRKYLHESKVSVDPFARNKRWATYTNDLSPDTSAEYHMEARDFLAKLLEDKVRADLVICDPPYSQVQVKRSYAGAGREYKPFGDDNNSVLYRETRDGLDAILEPNGIALSFGWNSGGFGMTRGYDLLDVLLICHGAAHNDTICIAERKRPKNQEELF